MRAPDVVLIVLDTARAFDVSAVFPDDGIATTPELERLAETSLTFTAASTPAPWTLPSHASLFTGLLPGRHGVYDGGLEPDGLPTMAGLLGAAGFTTVAVVANEIVGPDSGLDRGFQRFVLDRDANADLRGPRARIAAAIPPLRSRMADQHRADRFRQDRGGERIVAMASQLVRSAPEDRPLFLFVNLFENHIPYNPPPDLARRFLPPGVPGDAYLALMQRVRERPLGAAVQTEEEAAVWRATYRATLAYADKLVARLLAAVDRQRGLDRTLVIVTSDHGENCGERGMIDHMLSVHDTVLRIPLIVRPPGGVEGERRPDLATLCDVLGTVCETCGVDPPDTDGSSLLHAVSRTEAVSEYRPPKVILDWLDKRASLRGDVERWKRDLLAIRTSTAKYIQGSDGSEELYQIDTDPWETTNLVATHPDRGHFKDIAGRWASTVGERDGWTNDRLAESMRALGYID